MIPTMLDPKYIAGLLDGSGRLYPIRRDKALRLTVAAPPVVLGALAERYGGGTVAGGRWLTDHRRSLRALLEHWYAHSDLRLPEVSAALALVHALDSPGRGSATHLDAFRRFDELST